MKEESEPRTDASRQELRDNGGDGLRLVSLDEIFPDKELLKKNNGIKRRQKIRETRKKQKMSGQIKAGHEDNTCKIDDDSYDNNMKVKEKTYKNSSSRFVISHYV